jgi:hypothetical protein
MKGIKLLEKYPKAGEVIKAWYLEKMLESFRELNDKDEVPQDFIDTFKAIKSIRDEEVAPMIDASPSALFDLFDANEIYINIIRIKNVFMWSLADNEFLDPRVFNTRKEAETTAIEQAFELLDKKLCEK